MASEDRTTAEELRAELARLETLVAGLRGELDQASASADATRDALGIALTTQHETLARLDAATAEVRRLDAALAEFRASEAYRVGSALTWPARHALRIIRRRRS